MLQKVVPVFSKSVFQPWFYLYVYPKLKKVGLKDAEKYSTTCSTALFLIFDHLPLLGIPPDLKKISDYFTLAFLVDAISDDIQYKITHEDIRSCGCKDGYSCNIMMKEICNILHEYNLSNKAYQKLIECIEAQNESIKQFSETDYNKLFKLTMNKGGTAMQLFVLFFRDANEKELEDLYKIGGFVQFLEDYYDQEEDRKKGINTLFSLNYWNKKDLIEFAKQIYATLNLPRYKLLFLKAIFLLHFL